MFFECLIQNIHFICQSVNPILAGCFTNSSITFLKTILYKCGSHNSTFFRHSIMYTYIEFCFQFLFGQIMVDPSERKAGKICFFLSLTLRLLWRLQFQILRLCRIKITDSLAIIDDLTDTSPLAISKKSPQFSALLIRRSASSMFNKIL